jgi:iron complex transport system permease protein
MPHPQRTFWMLFSISVILLILSIIVAVAIGAVPLPLSLVVSIISHELWPTITPHWSVADSQIVLQFRLPRVLVAAVVGAALAVSGTTLQAMVRNPLADPYIFGISSGASVAAVAVLTLGIGFTGIPVSFAAFIGALTTMAVVYGFAQHQGHVTPLRLILAGVAIGYLLSAVTSYLVLRASTPGMGATAALSWLAGSLGNAKWEHLGIPTLVLFTTTSYLLVHAATLNALATGEETAITLGIDIERIRIRLFIATSLLVGTAVAISGAIGFVGLLIPHMIRMLVGASHQRVLPLAALIGASFLVLVDVIGRIIIAPQELPVGLVTAACGAPFFLWLMRHHLQARQS